MNKKKLIISLSVIGVVAVIVIGVTVAYFNDIETSEGNTFTAGTLDLKIDNHSWYNGEYQPDLSWELDDLTGHLFFNFQDLKPTDWGEDTISLHVNGNNSWACMDFNLYNADDNGLIEPEESAGDTTGGPGRGELQDQIYFVWWSDDGDNVLEEGENVFQQTISLGELNAFSVALADSSGTGVLSSSPLVGDEDYYIGKAWCFGNFVLTPVPQDNLGYGHGNGPDVRSSGINCNSSGTNNLTQSDSVQVSLGFRAIQSRNNDNFICESSCSKISFLYEDSFEGVDNPTGWSTDNSTVNLGTNSWSLLGGNTTVYGYKNGSVYNLTHRGTRGLGVAGGEVDEVDDPERIEIIFNEPVFINEFEVRSFFAGEAGGDEEGDVELYNGTNLVQSYHLTASEAGGNGVLETLGTDQAVDKIVFYVAPGESYTSFSEFAVAKLRVCPVE